MENQSSDLYGTYKALGVRPDVNSVLLYGFRKSSKMFGNSSWKASTTHLLQIFVWIISDLIIVRSLPYNINVKKPIKVSIIAHLKGVDGLSSRIIFHVLSVTMWHAFAFCWLHAFGCCVSMITTRAHPLLQHKQAGWWSHWQQWSQK